MLLAFLNIFKWAIKLIYSYIVKTKKNKFSFMFFVKKWEEDLIIALYSLKISGNLSVR